MINNRIKLILNCKKWIHPKMHNGGYVYIFFLPYITTLITISKDDYVLDIVYYPNYFKNIILRYKNTHSKR